ncbi:C4-dicarboxylate ABC transporter [Bordetella sp. J329]|jgi:TRAP-type C4-dicarboxylate transport system substrate-binding protein|uniref:TRAP transporter substrate-binding protein n=1 Tax=Kerstersia gyiorum TaxID=206506 RepID=UPI000FDAA1F5|nr:TRAP transporter substrate-binding protein [Kerstersia gyiorum]AZV94346.1 C4-dicarboxylate ABC transporter [Bordetella sp. J329]MCH4271385.1 TRAP transporter substrate-binding protein [Kerstersia gyiorum]MCI1229105.1 TRAP transporter substrate-binding protein [Kerstersia gyiorum]
MIKRKALAGLAAVVAMAAGGAAQAAPVILKVAHFLPPVSPGHTKFIAPWCEKIEAESNGELKCQIYPAMQLGGTPAQLFNQARDGVADIVWTLPGYTAGRFPISEVFELPFLTTKHEPSSRAIWDFVQKHAMNEFRGVKPLAVWVNGANQLHLRDKQVENLEELRGLKIRAPSRLGNKILAALGATPVGMPVPQMAESLSKGVIDGALVPWEVLPATKAHELTKFHMETAGDTAMTTATMVFVMNQRKYDSLTPEQKKVIDANSGGDTSAWVASQFEAADAAGREAAIARGNVVYSLSPEQTALWEQTTQPVIAEWIKEVSSKGVDGAALVQEARDLVKQYSSAQ